MRGKRVETIGPQDPRREQIEAAFFQMLEERPYLEITVSDLCGKLGIGRKVFYARYRDKEDCLTEVIDGILRSSLIYTAKNIPTWGLSMESAAVILDFWKEHHQILDIVIRDHLLELFIDRALVVSMEEKFFLQEILNSPEMPCDMDILNCFLGCHFSLILQWHRRGFDTPTEEMAAKYLRLVHTPLFCQKAAQSQR